MSSLTENQVVAAALSIGTFLMLWFADSVAYLVSPPFESVAINLSLIGHFKPMATGSVFLREVGYSRHLRAWLRFTSPPGGLRNDECGAEGCRLVLQASSAGSWCCLPPACGCHTARRPGGWGVAARWSGPLW